MNNNSAILIKATAKYLATEQLDSTIFSYHARQLYCQSCPGLIAIVIHALLVAQYSQVRCYDDLLTIPMRRQACLLGIMVGVN